MPNAADLVKMVSVDETELYEYLRTEVPDESLESFFGRHAADVRSTLSLKRIDNKKGDSIIILLPGLTGSLLEDVGSDADVLWINPLAFLGGHLNRLDLDEAGMKDATPGVRVEATKPIWLVYAKLMLSLQQEFEVHSFAYDWRFAPAIAAAKLKDFIDEKVAASNRKQVTLVGHSMGGLVIMEYLAGENTKSHAEKMVKRAITLGTPFKGALDAALLLAKGNDPKMEIAQKLNRANEPLKMLRSFPSIYQVLPAPNNLYPNWSPLPDIDIYDPAIWTIANIPVNAKHLATAKVFHERMAKADPQEPLYNVAGVYYATPVQLLGKMLTAIPRYVRDGIQGGDGTVEATSAIFKDRPAYFVQEVHIELVLEQAVVDAIKSWVEGGQPTSLVQQVDKVVLNDTALRGAAIGAPQGIITAKVASKISANQNLNSDDIQALFVNK